MATMEEDVVILGAGIAGLATALALKRVGVRAFVLEKSEGLRTTGAALSLFSNGILALHALGVSHKLTSIYPALERLLITNVVSGATQDVSLVNGTKSHGGLRQLHRKALLEALSSELPADTIRFSSKLTSIETQPYKGSSITILRLDDGTTIKTKIFVGCDGIHSMVAGHIGLSEPVDSGRWAVRGMSVFPEGHGFAAEIHQFVDAGKRAGFAPLNHTEIYWFMTSHTPYKDRKRPTPKDIQNEIIENSAKDFPSEFLNIVRESDLSTLSWAPLMFRKPWDLIFNTLSRENMTLAGDAMHPMTPDLGQGGGSALEDAIVLGRHIGKSFIQNGGVIVPKETSRAINEYVKERKWRVIGLIIGSYLSGWAQQDGSNWFMKWVRDVGFYKMLFGKFLKFSEFDCGSLPISSSENGLKNSNKMD